MCGRTYQPRFLWMWPNARISVMGGIQAASVMATVKKDQLSKNNENISSQEIEGLKNQLLTNMKRRKSILFQFTFMG